MPDNEFIPASLRIGATAAPRPEVSFDVLLRGIDRRYKNWMTNSPDWDRNDTRDLIITMKVALERMQQERDEAQRNVCEMEAECIFDPPCTAQEYAIRMGWDCFPEKAEADSNNSLFRTTDGE